MNHLDYCRDVELFQQKFSLLSPTTFRLLPIDLLKFRADFLQEEFDEFIVSHKENDFATAIDSLVDLIYVTCGTWLLHGLSTEDFGRFAANSDQQENPWRAYFFRSERTDELIRGWQYGQDRAAAPVFLSSRDFFTFCEVVQASIKAYRNLNQGQDIVSVLQAIYGSCRNAMMAMGLNQALEELVWKDVQRANMTKERALRAEDSKRGSTWDVIKPKGWIGPDPQAIIQHYIGKSIPKEKYFV